MKKISKIMTCMLMIAAFAATTVSCSKDDDENDGLTGRWTYREANMRFSFEGQWYDAKEEGIDFSSYLSDFSGLYFVFAGNGKVTAGIDGQSVSGTYRISGDELIIEGSSWGKYRVSGKTFELIWTHATMRTMGLDDSEFYDIGIDDYEFILTFSKG
jgi:hypothetical protein